MIDILAVPSSGARPQDRTESGRSQGDSGFASLLGSLTGKAPDELAPAERERPEDNIEETAAPSEVSKPAERPAEDSGKADAENAERRAAEDAAEKAKSDGGSDGGKTDRPGASSSQAAGEAGQSAAQPTASQQTATQQAGSRQTAAQQAAAAAALDASAAATATAAQSKAGPQAAQQAAAQALQAAANGFRLPGQEGQVRGQVKVEAAGQAPRAALSGNTALAASLAASGEATTQAGATGQADVLASAGAGQQGGTKVADGSASKTFAALATEAAGQIQGKDTAQANKAQGLQAPSGGDMVMPGVADAARVQAPQSAAAAVATNPHPPTQAPLADQVASQMHRAIAIGKDRLSIQLHPAELGRVDIKLDLGNDGAVRAVLHAERRETMDLLQRDVRGLERALQNAGLQTDGNSISFDLRGGSQQRSGQGFAQQMPSGGDAGGSGGGGSAEGSDVPAQPGRSDARHDGAVNIRV